MSAAFALLIIFGAAAVWAIAWLVVNAIRTVSGNRNKELKADNEKLRSQLTAAREELNLAALGHGNAGTARLTLEEITRLEIESQ